MSAYVVNLSDKSKLSVDADEVENVIVGLRTGSVVRVRQGLFNPSFFVSMTLDEKRIESVKGEGRMVVDLTTGKQEWKGKKLAQLKDIFSAILPPTGQKRLTDEPDP